MAAVPTDCGIVTQSTSLHRGPYWESGSRQASQAIPHRYSIRIALARSKKPETVTYREPDESSPYMHTLFFQWSFLAYFHYFEKIKLGLWDHTAVCVYTPNNFGTTERIFMTLGMYITPPEVSQRRTS
jgi:hypothetical protein